MIGLFCRLSVWRCGSNIKCFIRNVSPALATSYAYVNPVVAVLLGTGLGGETLSKIEWLALGVIVFAVVLVTLGKYLFPAKPVVAPVIQDASSE
ncbi:EamA family transporter [Escherichia coli]|nr:EamA family transporter [Escherichia coli]